MQSNQADSIVIEYGNFYGGETQSVYLRRLREMKNSLLLVSQSRELISDQLTDEIDECISFAERHFGFKPANLEGVWELFSTGLDRNWPLSLEQSIAFAACREIDDLCTAIVNNLPPKSGKRVSEANKLPPQQQKQVELDTEMQRALDMWNTGLYSWPKLAKLLNKDPKGDSLRKSVYRYAKGTRQERLSKAHNRKPMPKPAK